LEAKASAVRRGTRWDDVADKMRKVFAIGPAGIDHLKHHLDQGKSVSVTHGSGGIQETFGGAVVRILGS
jgi:hypothetical protein